MVCFQGLEGEGNGELLFTRHRVSVLQDERVMGVRGGDDGTTM